MARQYLQEGWCVRVTEDPPPHRTAEWEALHAGYFYLPDPDSFDVMCASLDQEFGLERRPVFWPEG